MDHRWNIQATRERERYGREGVSRNLSLEKFKIHTRDEKVSEVRHRSRHGFISKHIRDTRKTRKRVEEFQGLFQRIPLNYVNEYEKFRQAHITRDANSSTATSTKLQPSSKFTGPQSLVLIYHVSRDGTYEFHYRYRRPLCPLYC